jgi:hypothetical protein
MPSRRIQPMRVSKLVSKRTPSPLDKPLPPHLTKPTLPRLEADAQINKPPNAPADYVFHSDSSVRTVRVLGDVSKNGKILTEQELDQLRILWNGDSQDLSTADREKLEHFKAQLRPEAPYDLRNRSVGGEPKSFTDWPFPPPEEERDEVLTWLPTIEEDVLWNLDLEYFNTEEQGYIENCRNDFARRACKGTA